MGFKISLGLLSLDLADKLEGSSDAVSFVDNSLRVCKMTAVYD